ncbi:S-layer homology domain-containing protein [Paenibacillus sp. FSL R5-0887]|uniref:S-layer homology domain-containing protein n=1 Tax=Paenibacillus sp. FSL R5-0887 TaxID=2921662 RepID=UPI0030F83CFC
MNKKQWISSILAAAVLSSPIIMPTKGSAAASFIDIDGSYAKKAIVELFDQGIVTGVGESKFYPTSNITRQDFAIILAKTLKLDVSNPPALPTFLDVPTSNYAYSYVEAAVKAGLIKGTGSNLFGTGQNLSRQDMVVMFVRALGVNPTGKAGTLQFADSSQIADYSKDFIAAAVEYGLITGYNNFFNPDAKVDRQAVALVASKFLKFKENGNTEQPASTPTAQPSKEPVTVPTPVVGGSSSSQSEHSSNSDTNAPMVESTKFEAIDNYNGTQDQLRGLAGAIGEQGAAVQAYLWTDANENGEVDADELGTAIALGTSGADGSVSAADIGDLNAGTYRFVITAKDSSNNESAKNAAHAVTVTLSKNEVPDTTAPVVDATKFEAIDNYNGTQDQLGGLAGAIGEQGAAVQAYLWTDANENGEVDADELGTAIALGTSEADGSVNAANIGDLNAGTYRFVITAKDSFNNESAKNAAHVVTVTLSKNEVPDTSAPVVDATKFEAIDNYNGTQDQLRGLAGAIGEQGAAVQAYLWTDANENGEVDAEELGTAIALGTSAADGSVNAANIGDLNAGTYTFVITAKDSSNNESAKNAAHAVTVTLSKNEVPDTTAPVVDATKFEAIDNYNGTQDQLGGLAGAIGEQGAAVQAYLWTDVNENGEVDADELGTAIALGISEADGSVSAADIGDLNAGTYRFVITAKDSSNNESAKDAAHAVTVTLSKNEVPDTSAPVVDATKFEAIDNYNGTQDQLRGLAGAIGEQGAAVQAYLWTDANENGEVDADELGTALALGTSAADGAVSAANIGNLNAGTYRFVITAKDSSNNESTKNAAHAVTIELVYGILTTPTVTSSIYGFDGGGGSKTKQLITGSTQSRIRFDFFSGESFTNAEIQVTLEGITFTTNDYYTISGWTHPTSDQISNNGHTLTFTGSNIGVSDIAFELHNKVMPAPGTYLIKFKADADGPGTARSYSEEQVITLIILPPA